MSNATDFAAWHNVGTDPTGFKMKSPPGVVPLPTTNANLAMAAEFISGTWSTYTWVDLLKAINNDSTFGKILWNYAKVLGKVGLQTEWKG